MMFLGEPVKLKDTFGKDKRVYDAISEWALEQCLGLMPILNTPKNSPTNLSVFELADLITIEQVDIFKSSIKKSFEECFNELVDTTSNRYSYIRLCINNKIFVDAVKEAKFPERLIPPQDIYTPAINFCTIDGKKIITWEAPRSVGAVIKIDNEEEPYTSSTLWALICCMENNELKPK